MALRIQVDHEKIAEFCRRNRIARLSFFGSVLRDDSTPDSDIDVLVQFEAGASTGYFTMAPLRQGLSEIVGRPVDSRTPQELSRYFRDEVLAEARRSMSRNEDWVRLRHTLGAAQEALAFIDGCW